MLIADSQGKELDLANFTVLSLQEACVRHVYIVIPKNDNDDTVVHFIGANDLFSWRILVEKVPNSYSG